MKVPVEELDSRVTGKAYAGGGPVLREASTAVSRALESGIGSLGQATEGLAKNMQEADSKARDLAVAQALSETQAAYDRITLGDSSSEGRIEDAFDGTDTRQGFLSTKGTTASERSADVLEQMAKRRQEIADKLADPEARKQFETRAMALELGYRRQVEHHVSAQFEVAKTATVNGLEKQHVAAAEGGMTDAQTLQVSRAVIAERIMKLAPSEEAGKAAVGVFFENSHRAAVSGMLARGAIDGAAAYVEKHADELGSKFAETMADVKRAQVGAAKTAAKIEAESLAGEILKQSTKDDGYLDGGKAEAALVDVPQDKRIYVRTLIREQVAADAKRKKAVVSDLRNQARTALNHGNSFSAIKEVANKLEDLGDAEYVHRLQSDVDAQNRRAIARSKGFAAQANKEQAEANRLALGRYRNLSTKERAETNPADFAAGMGVDEHGLLGIGALHTTAKELVQRRFDTDADRFTNKAEGLAKEKAITGKKGMSQEKQAEYRAQAQKVFDDFVAANKRTPSDAEIKKLIDPLVADTVVRRDWWFDKKVKGFEAPGAKPQPAPAPVPVVGVEEKTVAGRKFRKVNGAWKEVK